MDKGGHDLKKSLAQPGRATFGDAIVESFYRTLRRELVQDAHYHNPEQARMDIFKFFLTFLGGAFSQCLFPLGWLKRRGTLFFT